VCCKILIIELYGKHKNVQKRFNPAIHTRSLFVFCGCDDSSKECRIALATQVPPADADLVAAAAGVSRLAQCESGRAKVTGKKNCSRQAWNSTFTFRNDPVATQYNMFQRPGGRGVLPGSDVRGYETLHCLYSGLD